MTNTKGVPTYSDIPEHYIFELDSNVQREHVFYKNRYGITLAGDMYTPKNMVKGTRLRAVVIGAPYSGVKEQGPGVWANELAKRGFAALTFDPSFNGYSGGLPRHVSSPDIFTEDFMAGVDFLSVQPFVDAQKIGAIGICGSGGFSLSAAAVDTRIKAVITASMIDISHNPDVFYTPEKRKQQQNTLAMQRIEDFKAGTAKVTSPYPAIPSDSIPEGLDPMTAEFWSFYAMKRGHHPNALGGFTATSDLAFMNYHLLEHIADISPRPVMILAGEKASTKVFSEEIFANLKEPKIFVTVPNANHVDLYDGGEDHNKLPWDKITDFLNTNLK